MTTNSAVEVAQQLDAEVAGQVVQQRFLASVAKQPDAVVLRWKDENGAWQQWTNAELADETARLTTGLRNLGVEPGDRVVLMMGNRAEFHALDLAVLCCGATPVSIYNSSAPDQVDYLVNHCKAKVAVLEDEGYLQRFRAVRDRLSTLEHIAMIETGGDLSGSDSTYSDLAGNEPADLAASVALSAPEDLATVIYTSGTTGDPKGVMISHRNVCWTLSCMNRGIDEQTELGDLTGKRYISYLPMAHVMERLLGHYTMIDRSLEITCLPDVSQIAAYAAEVHPHMFIGVPRVWEKIYAGVNAVLAADPEKAKAFNEAVDAAVPIMEKMTRGEATAEEIEAWNFFDAVAFSQVKPLIGLDECQWALSGAAPLPANVLTWFRAIGVPLTEGYGMSETTAVISWANAAKAGTVGRAMPGVEVILGEDNEVLARGGNMFSGYLDAPEKTAETLDAEGWVHTGDIGELDEEGYLRIVDRKKELIITAGGKNVSPANLEAALKGIPLVGQACAVGDQRPFVAALVVLDPDAAAGWAARRGLEGDAATPEALAENQEVIEEISAGLIEAMSGFNNAEAVKKVKVLGAEWMPDSDLLTPTSKLKRRGIHRVFADAIEEIYAK